MIYSLTAINFLGESIHLPLDNPYETGLAITSISGIGPTKATVNVSDLAVSDGGIFNSARVGTRNIVITFRLLEDPLTQMVEDTRQRTYKYFPLKKPITLQFETTNRLVEIQGYVESNEPDIFQKEETAQISIICPSPYFYSNDGTFILNGVESLFYFPFSNESLDDNLIEFSSIRQSLSASYEYYGDVDTGILCHFHIIEDDVTNISIYNLTTDTRMDIDTSKISKITKDGKNLVKTDDIYLSTIGSDRYMYLVRAGVTYNIISALPKDTKWVQVVKGSNVFGYTADTGAAHVEIEIMTNVLYEGV